MAMLWMLPPDAVEGILAPLRDSFQATYGHVPLLPWYKDRFEIYSEPVDRETIALLQGF